ncbi:MAG: HlyD family efflux transporter periplasmic adaptor subunit, partial [Planctomycetota bacterium]
VQDLAQLQAAVAEAGLELSLKQATLARQDQQRRPELDAQLAKLDERRDALRQIVAHNRTTVNSLKDETATQLQSLDEEIAARGVREKLLQAGAEADIRQYEQQRLQLVAQREASSESAKRLEKQAVAAQREYEQFRDAESGGMIESARVTAAHLAWLRADSDAAAARDQTKLLTLKEGEIAVQIEQVRARNALAIDELTREVLGLTNQRKAAMAALKVKLEEYDRLDAQSAADIAEVDLQASQLRSAFDQQREELLRDIDRATLKLGQAKERAALDAEVREVRAPIDGELTFVGPKSVGEFVPPGHHLATVAGPGAKMVALITLQNRDIANIKPGQSIKFKFDAWNFQTYGVVKGEVLSVSPDAVSTDKNGEGGYVYVVRATFDRHPPSRGGEKMTIRYGMTATAEIVQRTRRVIDILIEPFQKLSENFVP